MRRHRGKHEPVYDRELPIEARKLLGFRSRAVLSVLLLGVVAFVIVCVLGFFYISDAANKANAAADSSRRLGIQNSELIKQIQELQRRGRADRIENEKRIDTEIRNAVCLAVQNARKSKAALRLRQQFHCPKGPFTVVTIPPDPDQSPKKDASPTQPGATQPSPTPSAKPVPTSTVTRVRPGPTQTKTVTKTASPTRRAKPTPPVCSLLKILCP